METRLGLILTFSRRSLGGDEQRASRRPGLRHRRPATHREGGDAAEEREQGARFPCDHTDISDVTPCDASPGGTRAFINLLLPEAARY